MKSSSHFIVPFCLLGAFLFPFGQAGEGDSGSMNAGGAEAAATTPGDYVTGNGMKMIRVEPGQTGPLKPVDDRAFTDIRISEGYYLAETEVTQAQWESVMKNNPSHFKGANLPVERVMWEEAMQFCRQLTEADRASGQLPEGYVYALPTEKQWEYACRAGTAGDYAGPLDQMAWHGANSEQRTHLVGTKQANAWGFHDMHGNVWEWCADTLVAGRALRGGCWAFSAELCRSGHRSWTDKSIRVNDLGFRLAAVPSGSRIVDGSMVKPDTPERVK